MYQFGLKTNVHVGNGHSKDTSTLIKPHSFTKNAVIVSDSFLVQSGLTKDIENGLIEHGFTIHIFDQVQSNPTMTEIDQVADLIRKTNSDVVVGIGGGSPLDVAKTSSLVAGGSETISHYALGRNPFPEKKVYVAAIPTTAGTGAEVTSTVIFSDNEKRKLWGWDENMAPEIAILDASLTLGLPPHLTAATGLDAIVHAIEAATGQSTNAFTRGISYQAIRLIADGLPKVMEDPANKEARESLLLGSTMAGIAIEHGGTGLAHNIGHALSTVSGLHHGRAVALALYHVYDFNINSNYEATFAEISRALGITENYDTNHDLANEGGRLLKRLITTSPMDLTINKMELSEEEYIEKLYTTCLSSENAPMLNNNAKLPTNDELRELISTLVRSHH